MLRSLLFLSLCVAAPFIARADVTVPAIFGDHMVLQEDMKVPVWGWADPGEKVTVTAGKSTASATADKDGNWRVELAPFPSGTPPQTLTIAGKTTLTFQDVQVGEVWLCSGQSNMEYAMQGKPELAQANDPQLRLFIVTKKLALEPQSQCGGSWQPCTPDSAKQFSAVAYFFGRELRSHLNKPIGLIASYWGGSTAQAWTSLSGLETDPPFKRYIDLYIDDNAKFTRLSDHYDDREAAYNDALQKWKAAGNQTLYDAWRKELSAAQKAKQPTPPQTFPLKPDEPTEPGGNQRSSSNCYNGMIAPIIPFAMRGVIWYQGEYNVDDPEEYYDLFPRLIRDWRQKWGQGNFPFLFVQLPELWLKEWDASPKPDGWSVVREAQLQTLTLPNTGMAVAFDVGGALHPPGKLYVGQRLALIARNQVYGEASLPAGGPVYTSMEVQGNAIRLHFDPKNGDPVIGASPMADTAAFQPKDKLAGFQVAGSDKQWMDADAKIDGSTIVVSSPQVPAPVAARYGWGNGRYDVVSNLYDKDGLPASPFRTDDWSDVVPPNTKLPPGMALKP